MGSADPPQIISTTTVISLAFFSTIVATAYGLSVTLLPKNTSRKIRFIFLWHSFDALIHFCLEGAYLYCCFFIWAPAPTSPALSSLAEPLPMTPPGVYFLNQPSRLYGAFYSDSPPAKLWQEYAKADRRWGGADLCTISLELLTVFVIGPLAVYVCYLLKSGATSKAYFWMTFIATSELYGGFMTFAPEWLTGNPNLDGSNWMYMWLYLVFMNMLWVWVPAWILYESYSAFTAAPIGVVAGNKSASLRKRK